MNKYFVLFALCCALLTTKSNAATYSGSLSYNQDNNLSFGNLDRDIISDDSYQLGINLKHVFLQKRSSKLTLSAAADFETFANYDGLNNSQLKLKASYQFQFSNHFRSPTYSAYLQLGQGDYKSNLRDNISNEMGLGINWRYDDRTSLRAGASSISIDADTTTDGSNLYQTFDNQRNTLFLAIKIKQSKRLSLYSSISLISGDITANWSTQTIDDYAVSFTTIRAAWETIPDTIFANNWESTKYTADITKLALGFNYSLGSKSAIDTLFQLLDADAGIYSYDIERVSVSYLKKF